LPAPLRHQGHLLSMVILKEIPSKPGCRPVAIVQVVDVNDMMAHLTSPITRCPHWNIYKSEQTNKLPAQEKPTSRREGAKAGAGDFAVKPRESMARCRRWAGPGCAQQVAAWSCSPKPARPSKVRKPGPAHPGGFAPARKDSVEERSWRAKTGHPSRSSGAHL